MGVNPVKESGISSYTLALTCGAHGERSNTFWKVLP